MPLLRGSVEGIKSFAGDGSLGDRIATQFRMVLGRRVGHSELRSWEMSVPVLVQDLIDAGLGAAELLIEYQLPLSSKRVDAIVCGKHPLTGAPSYIVVELKQWSRATVLPDADDLVIVDGYGGRPVLHPGEQVRRYATFLCDFARSLEEVPDAVVGAAYLHNAEAGDVHGLQHLPETALSRVFTKDRRSDWIEFLQSRVDSAPGRAAADLLLQSRIAPSRKLMQVAAAEIRDREMFTLLDEQQVALSLTLCAVERAHRSDRKTVVVVTGGPGSGKSVIALSMLGELNRRGRSALHATGSKAFTETLRKVAGHRNSSVKGLFKFFNSFMKAEPNGIDAVICDEAHRIRETSNSRWTSARDRSDRLQVDELIDAARVPVFLLDEHQVVRPGESGTTAVIRDAAARRGLEVIEVDLDGQFRSGGSVAYDEWVLRLLGLVDGGPVDWTGDDHFELHVADSPEELEAFLAARDGDGCTARMTAGFCWKWSETKRDEPLALDVRIGDWARPWNNKEERRVGDAPARSLWAVEDGGFDQVGCVYTAQGFEYDWNGVIIGPDLVWRGTGFEADVTATRDPAFRGHNRADFDRFARNVYKVLLTRGMVGTVVHSTDAETQELLRRLVAGRP